MFGLMPIEPTTAMPKTISGPALDLIDNFPSDEKAGALLRKIITEHNYKRIADIGGGAKPMLDNEFIRQNGILYFLIDQSPTELEKAAPIYDKIEADATGGNDAFQKQIGGRKFDLIFSHMFLEHIEDPMQAHRNFYGALNPGGRCVHIYPSPNNLPLTLNRLLPEAISRYLLKVAQPGRDLEGSQRKFKAYYRMCGAPNPALSAAFEKIGYAVEIHTGYVGHPYYERFGPAAALEKRLRKIVHRLQLPLTAGCLLVLEKPRQPARTEVPRS
jgi:SAM-dependent methyltransferase